MPQRVAAGVAKCIGIRHLTDANTVKNNENHPVKSHLVPIRIALVLVFVLEEGRVRL